MTHQHYSRDVPLEKMVPPPRVPVLCGDEAAERARKIRQRVEELEAEVKALLAEHEALTGGPWGKVDADDIAWATGAQSARRWRTLDVGSLPGAHLEWDK